MNHVSMIGRLTKEVEIKKTQNGDSVADFRIAVNDGKDANGNSKAYFFNCSAFRGTADIISEYFHKGDRIGIEGKLTESQYTNREGVKVSAVRIQVNRIDFLQDKPTETYRSQPKPTEPEPIMTEELPF